VNEEFAMADSAKQHHPTSTTTYFLVFGALLVLTAATVWASTWKVGGWHTPIALAIAVTKATLIVLFFMHALESGRLVHLIIVSAVLWLAILIGLAWTDYSTRGYDRALRGGAARTDSPSSQR
jgi:cytochrome c oxidase subunit 4